MRKLLVALGGLFLCLSAQAQNVAIGSLTASGADCTTAGACVTLQFENNGIGSASIQLSGTFTATVLFEASSDKGATWKAITGLPQDDTSSTKVSSATTANTWVFNVASRTNIRARCSAFTSAPSVVIRSSTAVANAIGGGGGAVFASGGTTNNVIPKSNGSSQLADSSLTDNGTVISGAEPLQLGFGLVGTPTYSFSSGTNTGMWGSASQLYWSISGTRAMFLGSTDMALATGVKVDWSSSSDAGGGSDAFIRRRGAGNIALGTTDNNGAVVDQTISVQNAITGSDLVGGHLTLDAPLGTGLGAASKISINRAIMKATGTTAQTSQNAFAVGMSKTLSNTSATAQTIATITLGSNAGGGAGGTFTLVCTDGTNFDSETQAFTVSFVNKAGAVTVGTPAITTSTAANNSGSCTLGITAVASSNDIAIKVTPVFGTIVPTTVTLYPIITHSTNTVTFN